MKKLLLALFISASLPSTAQSWAAPGATWYYDFQYFALSGYERIQKIGDTMINSRQYDKLQIYRRWFDQSNQQTGSYYVPQLEFTRADSGVVYYYRDSVEYILYDFNAQAGDSWVLRSEYTTGICDTASVVVDSVSTMIINGDTLRKIYTSPVNGNGLTFLLPVVEKIGGLANLFPYTYCMVDIPQGYNLRCYSDSTGWVYHNPNWNYTCDDMMSVDEPVKPASFSVFADIQSQKLTLSGSQIKIGALIQVYDCTGKSVLEEIVKTNGNTEVNFAPASGAVYFICVTNDNYRGSLTFYYGGY